MPSMAMTEATIARPKIDAYVPGDKITFDPLSITMLVAEDMENYEEIYNWMLADQNIVDDISIYLLTSKKNSNKFVTFKNAFPTNIGSITFNVQDTDVTYAQLDVTFRYDYFTINNVT